MTRAEFSALFTSQLDLAVDAAEARFGHPLARCYEILRGSPDCEGRRITVDDALEELWISSDRFHRIIDLAVADYSPVMTWIWVREAGYAPSAFEEKWNDPPGAGPFKILVFSDLPKGPVPGAAV